MVRDIHGKEMIWVFLFREEVMFKVNKAASTVLKKGSAVLGISFVTLSAASAIPVTCQCSERLLVLCCLNMVHCGSEAVP